MNIKVIKSDDTYKAPISRLGAYKVSSPIAIAEQIHKIPTIKCNFKIGNIVRHLEEGILGKIKFVGSDKIAVVWTDNTRERMTLAEAEESLEYVDDVQTQVSPLTPQMSDKRNTVKEDLEPNGNEAIDDALASLDMDEIDCGETIDMDIDLEKITMQHKIAKMEKKLTSKKDNSMKTRIASEIVDLAISKGKIDADDADMEIMQVTMLNDEEFELYRQSVLDYDDDGSEVIISDNNEVVDENISKEEREAKKLLKSLNRTAGRLNNSQSPVDTDGDTRNIKGAKQEKFGFYNQTLPPTFEQQFAESLSDAVDNIEDRPIQRTAAPRVQQKSSLAGFENLQGPTKALMPGSKTAAFQSPTNSSLKDLFSNMEWTTISKIH